MKSNDVRVLVDLLGAAPPTWVPARDSEWTRYRAEQRDQKTSLRQGVELLCSLRPQTHPATCKHLTERGLLMHGSLTASITWFMGQHKLDACPAPMLGDEAHLSRRQRPYLQRAWDRYVELLPWYRDERELLDLYDVMVQYRFRAGRRSRPPIARQQAVIWLLKDAP